MKKSKRDRSAYKREYWKKNKDRLAVLKRRWNQANKAHNLEVHKLWLLKNRERVRKYNREYAKRNKERFRASRVAASAKYRANHPEKWKDYYLKNAESIKARAAAWYRDNPDRVKKRARRYYEQNIDKWREMGKLRYAQNPKGIYKKTRAYAVAHPEKKKAWQKKYLSGGGQAKVNAYRKANWEKLKPQYLAWSAKRRAILKGASLGDMAAVKALYQKMAHAKVVKCHWCKKPIPKGRTRQLDHLIPLSRGGKHCVTNLVPSCMRCNYRKWTKLPHEFTGQHELF